MTYIRTAVPLKVMPVAMRKRSWEEHVTQRSGLQYSFDDLDIICCHAVVCDALQSDLDISTYGRRGRCVSLPDWHREQWGEGRALAQAPGADIGATHPGSDLLPSMVDKAETLVHSSGDRPEVTSGDDEASHYEHAGLPEVRHFSDTPPAKPLNQGVTAETEEESCGSLNDCRRITDRENFTFQRNCYEDNNHEACSKSNAVDSYHFQDCLYRVVSKNEPILHEAGDTLLACCDAESDVKANLGETQKVNEECDSTDSTTEWLTGTACLETACLETACLETACLETAWLETPCLETACLETACLETACLETACLETACLETACLETACLETPCLETPCLETACLETAWLETPCLETACLETACLETACLETACLETACLETPCLETQCLETACLETACLEAACLETACLETACVRKTLEERDSDPLSVGLISADEVDGPMVGECVDAPSETNGHREEPCFGLLEKSHRAETTEAEPGCHEAEPGYHEAEPGCHEAERGDHEAEPGYHEAEPGYHEAEPGYHEAEPGCHEAEPGCPEAEPGYSKAEPGFHEAEPGYSKAEPGCPEAEPGCHEAELGYHKAEDNTVKLRKRKSSTGERERSRLDSMVLLIMKLDRLDRDIDSALSSTSSISNTPSLRKRNVPEMDFREINGGEISNSTQHLKIFHNLMCSTLSSSRPVVGPGVKHTAGIMPVISEKAKAEIEAKEVCDWLRAAGFPQYAQLYEDSQFPIEISAVTRDHDFLDRDAIEALCRRLNTLNQCAAMRLDVTPQRKRSEDSDEDEPWAISSRWTFQRDSKRWSRQEELDVFTEWGEPESAFSAERPKGLKTGDSAESVLTDLSEQPEVGSLHSAGSSSGSQGAGSAGTGLGNLRTGSVNSISGQSGANEGSSEGLSSAKELSSFPLSGRPGGKNTCSKAKSFLKRMESLRLKSSPSKKKKAVSKLMISGPVLQEGVDEDKLRRLNCVEISSLTGQPAPRSRSVSYSTLTTTTSSSSSSSAVSTPSPVTRARRRATTCSNNNNKRGGMYLEGFDALGHLQPQPAGEVVERNRRNQKSVKEEEDDEEDEEETIFFIPEGHKPGTFPTALSNSSPHIRLRGESSDGGSKGSCPGGRQRRNSASSLDSRLSLYDNVPSSLLLGREWETEEGLAYSKLDDILQHVHSLQLMVNGWSEEAGEEGDSDSALDSASPCPSSPLQNRLEEGENGSDLDSTGNSLNEQDETLTVQERRDSGVGASLTRSNRRPQKLRWNSFLTSHRPSLSSTLLQVDNQSVVQMNLLQKFSLLKLTALLERHAPSSKHGVSWAVPKFMKRIKVRDYKDRNVFGVPLQVIVQRTGQPLPQSIQQAMRYLRNQCLDQVGLFRKSGVKSRIQALRQMNETCPDSISYEGQSAFDVADMLKQYFRDLPEPLLTSKLSETFLQIYQYVPKDQRLQAIRAAALLLPDENREVLQVLLFFLSDVTANVQENQMTSSNLAVCLAPSLFHLNTLKRENSSPRLMHRKQSLGKPDQRDLNENLAATQGLAHMISECKKLFQIPEEMSRCRNSYTEHGLHPPKLSDLMEGIPGQPSAGLLKEALDSLLKEAKEKFRGYDTHSTPEPAELACKKVLDGLPLRLWKTTVEVPATPGEVLRRILRDQHRWDEDLLESRVVETLGNQAEIYQYVQNNMAPHPARDHVVLRTWVTDLPKGACAMVCTSVDHEGAAVMGVRANVLTARYFIEPCGSNKSRLTYISRIDSRGHCPEWYNKMAGHLCAAEVVRIRDSFTSSP